MNITEKLKVFFDSMYQRNLIPTINNPIRTPTINKKNSAVVIDHIITDCVLNCDCKASILKTDSTDHFPIKNVKYKHKKKKAWSIMKELIRKINLK